MQVLVLDSRSTVQNLSWTTGRVAIAIHGRKYHASIASFIQFRILYLNKVYNLQFLSSTVEIIDSRFLRTIVTAIRTGYRYRRSSIGIGRKIIIGQALPIRLLVCRHPTQICYRLIAVRDFAFISCLIIYLMRSHDLCHDSCSMTTATGSNHFVILFQNNVFLVVEIQ